eukprot:3533687-Rhodomonas_salina.3
MSPNGVRHPTHFFLAAFHTTGVVSGFGCAAMANRFLSDALIPTFFFSLLPHDASIACIRFACVGCA